MTHINIRKMIEHIDSVSRGAIELLFECDKHNINFNKKKELFESFLYPDFKKLYSIYKDCLNEFEIIEKQNNYDQMFACLIKIIDTGLIPPDIFDEIQKHKNDFNLEAIYYLFAKLEEYECNYTKAVRYYSNTIKQDPEWIECYYERGKLDIRLENHKGAIKDFTKAINNSFDTIHSYIYRSTAELEEGMYEKVVKDCKCALENLKYESDLKPYEIAELNHNLTVASFYLEDYRTAINYCYKSLNENYADFEIQSYLLMSKEFAKISSLEKAKYEECEIKILGKIVKYHKDCLSDLYSIATNRFDRKNNKYILDICNACIKYTKRKKYKFLFYIALDCIYFGAKQYYKSLEYINKAILIDPNEPHLYYSRALSYYRIKDYELALGNYKKALELFKQQGDKQNCNLTEGKIKRLEAKIKTKI